MTELVVHAAERAIVLTMMEGTRRYATDAWKSRNDMDDMQHILEHLYKWQEQDTTEHHLEHALTRLSFILARKCNGLSKSTSPPDCEDTPLLPPGE